MPPPLQGLKKNVGAPKDTFPETNKQVAIVSTVGTWKLMIFGVHMKFPSNCQDTFPLYRFDERPAGYFLDSVCDQIFEIDWNGETFTHPGSWETFLKRRAERFWKYNVVVLMVFWKGMRDDENWWKLGNCLKVVFLDDVVEKVCIVMLSQGMVIG